MSYLRKAQSDGRAGELWTLWDASAEAALCTQARVRAGEKEPEE